MMSHENKSDGGSYGDYGFVSDSFDGGFEICPQSRWSRWTYSNNFVHCWKVKMKPQ